MRYIPEFDDYSETNKFLDDLFKEDCAFDWQCTTPNNTCNAPSNITDTNPEGVAEETYLKSLAADISEKIAAIIEKMPSLPDAQSRDSFFTKAELISRMISISNSLDSIISEFSSVETANNLNTTIVSGDISLGIPSMF